MRRLAWWAFAAVVAQALLGGALVKLIDPKVLAIAHASLAEICFGLTVAIVAGYYGAGGAGNWVARLAAAVLFLQAVLGAAVRHGALGVAPHIVGAVIAAGVAMWASLGVMMKHRSADFLRARGLFRARGVGTGSAAYAADGVDYGRTLGDRGGYSRGGDCSGDDVGGWETYVPVGRFSSFFRRS
jgi:hypothetical protein